MTQMTGSRRSMTKQRRLQIASLTGWTTLQTRLTSNSITNRLNNAAYEAKKKRDTLDNDDDKKAAANYYNRGLACPVNGVDAISYEIITIGDSIVDIIAGILEVVSEIGTVIAEIRGIEDKGGYWF
jgi:hypothetical protein